MSEGYFPVFFDIETTGLNPLAQEWHYNQNYDAQVYAVSLGTFPGWPEDTDNKDVTIVWDKDEYRMLDNLRKQMKSIRDSVVPEDSEPYLVGYNSREFDHPYLVARYSRKRQDPFPFCHSWKRLDMMKILFYETGKNWKEDEYAEFLGIEVDDEYTGEDMPEAFANEEWEKIFEHVRSDTEVLMEMFAEEKEMFVSGFYSHYDIDRDVLSFDDVDL